MTTVTSQLGQEYECHTYQVKEPIVFDDPSPQYLHTLISGAQEHHLPEDYIDKLTREPDNGYQGEIKLTNVATMDTREPTGGAGETMSDSVDRETFYYFGFGSNMSTWRIHIHCPSARFVTAAKLPGYALRFVNTGGRAWHGAGATVCEEEGAVVWGVLWMISKEHLPCLDE